MRHLVIDNQFTRVGKIESLLLDKKLRHLELCFIFIDKR